MKKLLLLTCAGVVIGFSYAHQPRLIFQQPIGQVMQVENPEISQAFYGDLSGQEDSYQIVATTGFLLYISLVVPDLSGSRTDFVAYVIKDNATIFSKLDGATTQRKPFYEKFAGDNYLQGPKQEQQVSSGIYTIIVSNTKNQGKYSLAIGKIESFPVNEMIKTIKAMPALKMVFFEKPRYTLFLNYIGGFFLGIFLIAISLIWLIIKLFLDIKKK